MADELNLNERSLAPDRRIIAAALAAATVVSLVGFWPSIGAGFQQDDFRWLWHARVGGAADVGRIFTETLGFYRPFTTLLWSFDLARAGPSPLAFSLTNLAVHLLVLALFAGLAARLLGRPAAAATAVMLAALSHHYNTMAVIWISGRGALLSAAAALVAIWLWERWCRGRAGWAQYAAACLALAVALGSYEAAAGLPVLMAFLLARRGERALVWGLGPMVLWIPFALARSWVGARQPWAPGAGYEYRLDAVVPNVIEYSSRALLPGAALILILLAIAAAGRALREVRTALGHAVATAAPVGLLWAIVGVAPALPVPNRSSLYVYFAALGVHMVAATGLAAGYRELRKRRSGAAKVFVGIVAIIVVVAWPPFAWDRNGRFADQGRLAMVAVEDMRGLVPAPGPGECLLLVDDPSARPNLRAAFSSHLRWVGAYAYDELPSERIRYSDEAATVGEPCARWHRLVFEATDERSRSSALRLLESTNR